MFYKITLTASGGLSSAQVETIKEYVKVECKHAYIVNEFGESKMNSHLEGVVEFDSEVTSNITGRFRRLYDSMDIEVVPRITISIKRATHLVGCLIYASKELLKKGNVILLKGWEQSWIDRQIKENVKSIPHSMLTKKGVRVTQGTGPALIHEWCLANNMQVIYKKDYFSVTERMGADGYMFGKCRHVGLYQDVVSLFGSGRAVLKVAESELRFIE